MATDLGLCKFPGRSAQALLSCVPLGACSSAWLAEFVNTMGEQMLPKQLPTRKARACEDVAPGAGGDPRSRGFHFGDGGRSIHAGDPGRPWLQCRLASDRTGLWAAVGEAR
jgi:hypothetical protein